MTNAALIAIAGFALLEIKHFLCDFVFQTARHVQFKGIYGHPAGLEHSAIHVIGTIPCLWLIGAAWPAILVIAAAEFLIHYHEDWLKERLNRKYRWTPADHVFWIALGADQLVHHLTYVAMIAVILGVPGALR
jgi:hypothetical protein